jgi:hypothetical protein
MNAFEDLIPPREDVETELRVLRNLAPRCSDLFDHHLETIERLLEAVDTKKWSQAEEEAIDATISLRNLRAFADLDAGTDGARYLELAERRHLSLAYHLTTRKLSQYACNSKVDSHVIMATLEDRAVAQILQVILSALNPNYFSR